MSAWVYLHGFASSARSSKGRWLQRQLGAYGIPVHLPDLNQPSFNQLNLAALITSVRSLIAGLPQQRVTLVGSSLGGQIALQVAQWLPQQIERLILLAPALDFAANRQQRMQPAELARWEREGALPLYNYRDHMARPVSASVLRNAAAWSAREVAVSMPTLIIHGLRDASVPYTSSVAFAQSRPNVSVCLIDDDHDLTHQPETLWAEIRAFAGLFQPRAA